MSDGLAQLEQSLRDEFSNLLATMKADTLGGFSLKAAMPNGDTMGLGHVMVAALKDAGLRGDDVFAQSPAFYDYMLKSDHDFIRNTLLAPGGMRILAQNFVDATRPRVEERINFDYLFLIAHLNQSSKDFEKKWGEGEAQFAQNALDRIDKNYAQLQLEKLRMIDRLDVPALIKSTLISSETKKTLSLQRAALLKSDDETDILESLEPSLQLAAIAAVEEKRRATIAARERVTKYLASEKARKYYSDPENRAKTATFRAGLVKKLMKIDGSKLVGEQRTKRVNEIMRKMRNDHVIPGSAKSGAYVAGLVLEAKAAMRKAPKIAAAAIIAAVAPAPIIAAVAAAVELSAPEVLAEFPGVNNALDPLDRPAFWAGIEEKLATEPEDIALYEKVGQTEYLRALMRTLDAEEIQRLIESGIEVMGRNSSGPGGPK